LLDRAQKAGHFAGVSPRNYPADPRTFFGFQQAPLALPDRHVVPEPRPFGAVAAFLHENAAAYPHVRISAG
jgi:hypothetical protein